MLKCLPRATMSQIFIQIGPHLGALNGVWSAENALFQYPKVRFNANSSLNIDFREMPILYIIEDHVEIQW